MSNPEIAAALDLLAGAQYADAVSGHDEHAKAKLEEAREHTIAAIVAIAPDMATAAATMPIEELEILLRSLDDASR